MKHHIFSPLNQGKLNLKNRLTVAPMTRNSAEESGEPNDLMTGYYENFAAGGFGMIISEGTYTDDHFSRCNPNQPGIVAENHIKAWKQITDRVKKYDSLFICQLMHAGALSEMLGETVSASQFQPQGERNTGSGGITGPYPVPSEMSHEDIEKAVKGFIQSAKNARDAGFDGIEIHAANGYLWDQFLTGYSNVRKDNYGGPMANRFRPIAAIIAGIRKKTGDDFIVGLRLSESKVNYLSYRFPGGPQTAVEILNEAAKTQLDYVHIAAEGGNWARECLYEDGSSFSGIARQVTGRPVIANGGMHDLQKAEQILASGHGDIVSLGRAALADPYWPKKTFAGEIPLAFHKSMIQPYLTIEHANSVISSIK
jgi:2,4-dienoyl-CoA reductase-like NADH-dependent reductase (Old Yellow Enzyme family)